MAEKSRRLSVWLVISFIAVSVGVSRAQMLGNCELPDLLLAMRNCEANFVLALCHNPEQDCWNHQNITTVNACAKTSLRNCFEGTLSTESLDPMVDGVWNNLNYNVTEQYCTGDKFEGPFFPSNDGTPACSQEYLDVLTSCETDFVQKYLANISDPTLCREFGAMTVCKLSAVEQHCNLTDDNTKLLNATWGTNYNPFCLCPNVKPTTHAPTTPRPTAPPLGRCSVDDLIRNTQQCESEFIYALCTNPDIDCLTHPELPTLENCTRDVYHDCIVGIFPDAMVEGFLANFVLTLNAAGLYCNGTTFQPAEMRTSGEGEECTQQYSNDSASCVEAFIGFYLSNKSHPELCREYTKMTDCKKSALEEHCHSVHFNKLYEIRLRLSSDYNPFCQCPNQYGGSTTTTTTTTPVRRSSTVTAPLPSMIGTAARMTETMSPATTLVTTKREATSLATADYTATYGTTTISNTPTMTSSITPVTPGAITTKTQTASTMTTVHGASQAPTYSTTMTTTTQTVTTSVSSDPQTTTVTIPRPSTTPTTSADTAIHTVPTTKATSMVPSTTPSTLPTTIQTALTTTKFDTSTLTTSEMDKTTPTTREMGTTATTTRDTDTTTPTTIGVDTTPPTTREVDTTTPTTRGMDTTTPTVKGMDTTTSTTRDPDTTTPTMGDTIETTNFPSKLSTRISRTTTNKNYDSDRTTERLETAEEQGPPVAVIAAAAGGVTVLGVGSIAAYIIKLKFCKPSRVYVA